MSIRNILLLLGFLLVFPFAQAGNHYGRQSGANEAKKFSFSFNPGYGIPLMDLAKKSYLPIYDSTHAYGFANPGFHFEVCATYLFTTYVGVALDFGGTICPLDANTYTATYTTSANTIAPMYDPPNVTPPPYISTNSASVTIDGSNFIAQYLGGPYFYIPINDKFCFEIRAMAGLISSTFPDITVSSTTPYDYRGYFFKYAVGQGFGYAASVGVKYMVDPNIGIVANVHYTGGTITYAGMDYNYTTITGLTYGGFSFTDRTMSVGILSFTAGFALCF